MQIIVPKRIVAPTYPLFFLAGPIRGGNDWQATMCRQLEELLPKKHAFSVACPCRWGRNQYHPLANQFAPEGEEEFPRQLDWERYYLGLAAIGDEPGCIIFWLPVESTTNPHPGPDPYAMDTRGELGEWRGWMMNARAHVVIGAEPGFPGLSQIQRNFNLALCREFPIYTSMRETAQAAIKLAYEP